MSAHKSLKYAADFESPSWRIIMTVAFPLYIVISGLYLLWRFSITINWHTWYAFPLLGLELYSVFMTILYLAVSKTIAYPEYLPPLKNKTVDIFIPTYNESLEIVKMTAIGATKVKGARRVYILDDGNRKHIKKLADDLNVTYIARTSNEHAKAGNLNNALKYSDADFILCLDCDHVPLPGIINRILGYFSDHDLAFIQTPQTFYNTDSVQFRNIGGNDEWNEQSMFYSAIQPTKNVHNAAFFCGSGAMIRRTALDSIGGFATGTVTEDIHSSIRFHALGWKSLYINEQLAYGIAPDDLIEYQKQRVRWGAGSVYLLFRSKESPLWLKGLSFAQRICYLNSMIGPLNGSIKIIFILLPAFILITLPAQSPESIVSVGAYLAVFIPYYIFSYIISYLYSRKTFHPIHSEQFNIANILPNILALFEGALNVKTFKVSNKSMAAAKESNTYRFVIILLAIVVAADILGSYYWFIDLNKDMTGLIHSLTGISFFWNNFNLVFICGIVWAFNFHVQHPANNHAIKTNFRATLSENVESIIVRRISLRGAEIICEPKSVDEELGIWLKLNQNSVVKFEACIDSITKLKSGKAIAYVRFTDLSLSKEIFLTQLIFHKLIPNRFNSQHNTPKRSNQNRYGLITRTHSTSALN